MAAPRKGMHPIDRIMLGMFVTMIFGCMVMQAYLTGWWTAHDEIKQLMTQEDWLLTLQIGANK